MRAFHPAAFRAMARASAQNLRDVLPRVDVPTLLIYGARDVRAPLPVAEDLEASIRPATLVVLPDMGHVCNIEAPEAFNQAVRSFLRPVGRPGSPSAIGPATPAPPSPP
jgi:pimeloyl-ACP methyl ester carboxylesterase